MILDSTSKRIRVYLDGPVTTTELDWYASYADLNDDDPSFYGLSINGITAGATPVEMVPAPSNNDQRQVKNLTVFNLDTVAAIVWIEEYDGDSTILFRAELAPLERLTYFHEVGWTVYTAEGGAKPGIVSPLTTKGDIWGYDTADARIPVGADGQVLVADSTQTLGVLWRTVPRPVLVTTAVAFAASPYAVLDADDVILVDASLGNVEVDLPAAGSHEGRLLRVKKTDASINTVTIDPSGAELIDGAANLVLALQHEVAGFVSDGTEWWIV